MIVYDWTVKFKKTHGDSNPLREGLVTDMVFGTHSKEDANNIIALFDTEGCFSNDTYTDFEVTESSIELAGNEHKLRNKSTRVR